MWPNEQVFMMFMCGMMIGILLTMGVYHFLIRGKIKSAVQQAQQAEEAEEEKERNDPANWWKHGGDPFGKSSYRSDID
jgi:hypothetical protein